LNGSILTTIKQLIGISEHDDSFDINIVISINSVLTILSQLGVKEADGFTVNGVKEEWSDLIGDRTDLEYVKTYISLKVKMIFDPPQSSAAMDSFKRMIDELEWRISNMYVVKEVT